MPSRKQWIEKCDTIFREKIREVYDGTRCFACDQPLHVGEYPRDHPLYPEVCHWQNRRKLSTRWCVANVALGHRQCNKDENDDLLEIFLRKKFGPEAVEGIRRQAQEVARYKWFHLEKIYKDLQSLDSCT